VGVDGSRELSDEWKLQKIIAISASYSFVSSALRYSFHVDAATS
jgi:hypothetical protein